MENNTVAVRTRSGEDLGSMDLAKLAKGLEEEIASRGRHTLEV
jgi:threonyl-tRNA synthetase